MESGGGSWCGGADEVMVVVGHCICKREAGDGVWAKKPKPSCCGSISGALCKTANGNSA